jgi:hypothetical protein
VRTLAQLVIDYAATGKPPAAAPAAEAPKAVAPVQKKAAPKPAAQPKKK